MRKLLLSLSLATAAGLASNAAVIRLIDDGVATGAVGSDPDMKRLTVSYHMVAANEYHLDGIVIVNPGVTLTIDPGTVIRGYNEISTSANRPGTLVVDRGGKILANGTAANPIIMTDQWDNNVPGQTAGSVTRTWYYRAGGTATKTMTNHAYNYGQLGALHGVWGGLVVCGKAFASWNKSVTPALGDALIPIEGVGTTAGVYGGGRNDDDSSGVIKYVQIRYGGYTLADGSEINGLTLYCVGRGTELHHVEVYNNQDDGIEWFGGTVNGKYLVVWGAGDDTFDSDAGYRGKNQFLLGVQRNLGGTKYESGCSDKGLELDGTENACVASPGASGMQEPLASSLWCNMTVIGWNGGISGSYWRNGAITMRDNATPQIFNSVFLNFGGFGSLVENVSGVGNYHSRYHFNAPNVSSNYPSTSVTNFQGNSVDRQLFYQAQAAGRQACIRDNVFWGTGAATCPTGLSGSSPIYGGDTTKGPIFTGGDNLDITLAGHNNVDVFEDADLPVRSLATTAYSASSAWGSSAFATLVGANSLTGDNVSGLNPCASNAAVTAAVPLPNDGWLTAASYRGAFDASNNWAQGWTTVAKLGAFGAYVPVSESSGGTFNGLSSVSGTFTPVVGDAVSGYEVTSLVTFNGVAGTVYQLQSSAAPGGPWSEVMTFRCDEGGAKSVTDILGTAPAAATYYRVIQGTVD